jgi:hypothetical protein
LPLASWAVQVRRAAKYQTNGRATRTADSIWARVDRTKPATIGSVQIKRLDDVNGLMDLVLLASHDELLEEAQRAACNSQQPLFHSMWRSLS